uniref:Band 3 cytoplasmic domain-containing protein n=1 Tax=Romanomermis culicivorax TaxID=13658 RepID=A0A915KR79_ROMCU
MLTELFDLHRRSCNYDDEQQIGEIGEQILEWKVSARWFKYEEDVEGVDHFWGRPHVSFLLLKSFYHFKQLFGKGLVILDPLVTNFDELNRFLRKTFETELSLDKKTAAFLVNLLSEKKVRYSGSNLLNRVSSKLSFVRNPRYSEPEREEF